MKDIVEVVAALIESGDKFLICQRSQNKARAMLWEFVGGKVEPGEAKPAALARECKEELNVDINVGAECASVLYEYPDITVRLTLYRATIQHGAPTRIEHNDLRWITAAEVSQYKFCPADRELLKKIDFKF